MNWKICIAALSSLAGLLIPQNLIGCADGDDPYDYYTSFFSRGLHDPAGAQKPFYYTALLKMYDDQDWDATIPYHRDDVVTEWRAYCGGSPSPLDVAEFVYNASESEARSLLQNIRNGASLSMPDSLRKNGMVACLQSKKSEAAVAYLAAAKGWQLAGGTGDEWEARTANDSLALNKKITEAGAAYTAATDPFLKTKYAMQSVKLLFYNNRHKDVLAAYDRYFSANPSPSAAQRMALSYRGGSLFRLGRKAEAAYTFTNAFHPNDRSNKNTYLGFLWATDFAEENKKAVVLKLATTPAERAKIAALFAMHGTKLQPAAFREVLGEDKTSPLLPLLASREIAKAEESILTPLLASQNGGKPYYFYWSEPADGPAKTPSTAGAAGLATAFTEAANATAQKAFYHTAAAYMHYMAADWPAVRQSLQAAKTAAPDARVADQQQLIGLLTTISEAKSFDASVEASILPQLEWLRGKAEQSEEHRQFYRNLFSQIIAQRYESAGDLPSAALAYGVADLPFRKEDYPYYGNSIEFLRNEMPAKNLVQLHEWLTKSKHTPYDLFLIINSKVTTNAVLDVIGTSYLRDHNFAQAIAWLGKGESEPLTEITYNYETGKERQLNVEPFHDYLNDPDRLSKLAAKPWTKLSFAKRMLELQQMVDTAKTPSVRARALYTLASGFYNMSYYGNAWQATTWNRSGSDWNEGNYKQPWQREYYGVYKAHDLYKEVVSVTPDRELKAAAYFLMTKCAQRQLLRPPYEEDYKAWEKKNAAFGKRFRESPQFASYRKDFGDTKFYAYSLKRCSYLRDFVKKNPAGITNPKTPSKAVVWTAAEKQSFLTHCENGARANMVTSKAKSYCACVVNKLQAAGKTTASVGNMTQAELAAIANVCKK